jgi:CSLREA domain-containing protein
MKGAITIVNAVVLLILWGWGSPALAATFVVNSVPDAGDSNPGNGVCATAAGVCTLRAAIEETNALPSVLFNPDVIHVPAGVYLLSLGALTVTDHLRIIGAREGEATVVDGQRLNSVFIHRRPADADRRRAAFPDNPERAGTVRRRSQQQLGNLLIHRSRIQLSDSFTGGGGIYNAGESILSLVRSWVFNNGRIGDTSYEPQRGGGLYNSGIAFIDKSTISHNTAGRGGGIYQPIGRFLIMRNSTVSFNTGYVETGGIIAGGIACVNNATIVHNQGVPEQLPTGAPPASATGGLYGSGSTFIANTIVARNTLDPSVAPHDCAGTVVSAGYNLLLDPSGCTLAGDLTGNVTGQDPLLGTFAFNGGDTPNFSLAPGSPAINNGNPAFPTGLGTACEPTDQRFRLRGIRPGVGKCDIGSYESGGGPGEETSP